jgi:hypothetical protein
MFARKFSFWRKLVGRRDCVGSTEDDRRVWVRYPANLETTLQPPGDTSRFAARVRDISRGGVNLVADRAFQPGDHLSLELPAPAGQTHNVLACIVRVTAEPEGQWALGCTFSRELSDEDLQDLGARREKHAPADQRTWIRFPCEIRASYQQVGGDGVSYDAQVQNISASGIALLVPAPVETGVLLTVELHAATGTEVRTILACVVHAASEGEGAWALGCNFIRELTEDDLNVLVTV